MEFDIIGLDVSITNALRRILISEVPTMAIEKCYIHNNTGVMHDEIMCSRLGLIPIDVDANQFEYKEDEEEATDANTIVFKVNVTCTNNPKVPADEMDLTKKYNHRHLTSGDLEWVPYGDQEERFKDRPIRAVDDDIVITKLRPGDKVEAELHCRKGTGRMHAKWSPVATASYRMLPEIKILKPITGKDAHKFKNCFPLGVVKITQVNGVDTAEIDNPRKDTASRECLRHPEFAEKVQLARIKNHFICKTF